VRVVPHSFLHCEKPFAFPYGFQSVLLFFFSVAAVGSFFLSEWFRLHSEAPPFGDECARW
jgi:hypothetical protein